MENQKSIMARPTAGVGRCAVYSNRPGRGEAEPTAAGHAAHIRREIGPSDRVLRAQGAGGARRGRGFRPNSRGNSPLRRAVKKHPRMST